MEEPGVVNREGRGAGLGGVLFAASLAVGFTLFGPKGGQYSAAEVAAFVAQGATALIVSVYLVVVSIIGLWVLTSHLADSWLGADGQGRVARGAGLAAGTSFLVGWGLYLAVPASVLGGGPAIEPGITYAFTSAGMLVYFGAGGMLLGIAQITLATGAGSAPGWIRAFTGLAGLAALSSWAFLLATGWSPNQWLPGPFYVVILWSLVVGIWLLVSPAGRVD